MKKYFIHDGKEQQGPYSIEELTSKGLTAKTMIWFEGIANWTEAQYISELKQFVTSTPPPFERPNPLNQTFDKAKKVIGKDYVNEIEGKISNDSGKKIFKYALLFLAIIGLAFIIKMIVPSDSEEHMEKNNATKFLFLKDAILRHKNPNSIFSVDNKPLYWDIEGQISNSAKNVTYKDIKLEVEFFTETNTSLGKTTVTVYKVFPPNNLQDRFQNTTFFEIKLDEDAPKDTYTLNTKVKILNAGVYDDKKTVN